VYHHSCLLYFVVHKGGVGAFDGVCAIELGAEGCEGGFSLASSLSFEISSGFVVKRPDMNRDAGFLTLELGSKI